MALVQMIYPGNNDLAKLNFRLTPEEVHLLLGGQVLEVEGWVGASEDETLPVKVRVGLASAFDAEEQPQGA